MMYESMAKSHPTIERGRVWCIQCGTTHRVDPARCFQVGWPKCCGQTMTLDSPEERARFKNTSASEQPK